MNRESQCKKVLAYIRRHGSITRMDSIKRCNTINLPGRVWDLNRRRKIIDKVMEKSRDGIRYARYFLA